MLDQVIIENCRPHVPNKQLLCHVNNINNINPIDMPGLCYALIARQKVVLCDHASVQGNYETPSLSILENLVSTRETRISYEVGSHVYHVVISGPLRYLCVSDPVFDRGLAFGCLAELETRLHNTPGLAERAEYVGPYALRGDFSGEIASVLELYSSNDKLDHLQSQVKSVTGVMTRNLERVMQRGETLDDLEDRSQRLAHSSTDFRQLECSKAEEKRTMSQHQSLAHCLLYNSCHTVCDYCWYYCRCLSWHWSSQKLDWCVCFFTLSSLKGCG